MRMVAIALIATLLAACSATDFQKPVAAFDDAVTQGARLVDAYGRERAGATFAVRRTQIAQRADGINLRGADCRLGAAPDACVLRVGPNRVVMVPPALSARPAELAMALATYADNLTTVATAETEADFERSTQRLADAVKGLAKVLPNQAGDAVLNLADPASAGISALGGLVVQQRRFTLLRRAINAADPAVQDAAIALADVTAGHREQVASARAAMIGTMVGQFNALQPTGGTPGPAALAQREALLSGITQLQEQQRRLLADDPAAELRKLGDAHAALRRGVNDPTPPIAQLVEQLKRLSDRLRGAADAVQRLSTS